MKSKLIIALVLALGAAAGAAWFTLSKAPPAGSIGATLENVSLTGLDGKAFNLKEYAAGRPVVIFESSVTCPMSKSYLPALTLFERHYAQKGVAFLFVNSIATDSEDEMRETISRNQIQSPYVHDKDGKIAAALGLRTTTDLILADGNLTVRYHGAVDDRLGVGTELDKPRNTYLKNALQSLLAGEDIATRETDPSGCVLEVAAPPPASGRGLTYQNRIAAVIENNCVECHRAGGLAPFSLERYEDVAAHKGMVDYMVSHDRMPPWIAAKSDRDITWVNNRSLAPQDKKDLLDWLRSDLPRGSGDDTYVKKTFTKEWRFGKPDLVLKMPEPYRLPATGFLPIVNVTIPNTTHQSLWIKSLEIRPSNPAVVHHILVLSQRQGTTGFSKYNSGILAVYVPSFTGIVFPEGSAKLLAPDREIVLQIHYNTTGKPEVDQTEVGLRLMKGPPKRRIYDTFALPMDLLIPPNVENFPVSYITPVAAPYGFNITAILPHMHLRGKAARVEVIEPDGKIWTLLDVPKYNFNWQQSYIPEKPIHINKGSRIRWTGWFDNSAKNPANPNPNDTVKFGIQTTQEMLTLFIDYYLDEN